MSPKRAARRDAARKFGLPKIPKLGDPNVPDYHTGKESAFTMKRGDSDRRFGDIECGPIFPTPQWLRTVKQT